MCAATHIGDESAAVLGKNLMAAVVEGGEGEQAHGERFDCDVGKGVVEGGDDKCVGELVEG